MNSLNSDFVSLDLVDDRATWLRILELFYYIIIQK